MQSLSRTQTHRKPNRKSNKRKNPKGTGIWWLATFFLMISASLVVLFIRVPEAVELRQTLEATLFFFSGLFLVLYMASFVAAVTHWKRRGKREITSPNGAVTFFWIVATLFHLGLWLRNPSPLYGGNMLYQTGILLTLAGFIYGITHYIRFFQHIKQLDLSGKWEADLELRQQGYKLLEKCLAYYQVIREAYRENEEVRQMLKWNEFDWKMEERMKDLEPFWRAEQISKADVQQIESIMLWFKNLVMIVEQHPAYRHLSQRSREQVEQEERRVADDHRFSK